MATSGSQALRARISILSALLGAAAERMLSSPDLARLVPAHLMQQHQIIRASVPLMEAARREASRGREDPVCRALIPYLEHHIEEERHHDEWTLRDLASIGIAPAQTLAAVPSATVAALVGAQYYWILHYHPVALLGYIAMTEGNAPSEALIQQFEAASGLPDSVFRTLRLHAAADPHHRAALDDFVDGLLLGESHERLIVDSAIHTGTKLADCMIDTLNGNSTG
jgi:Iron-containing redox enzyme